MREKFWAMLVDMKYTERYYWNYQIRSKRIDGIISAVCMLASASSIVAWSIWDRYPLVWALIISFAQVLIVTKPLHPQTNQLIAFKFIIPALSNMLVRIEHDWEQIDYDTYDDQAINSLIAKYRNEYNKLESTYIGALYLPLVQNCAKKAEIECKNYMSLYYDTSEVDLNE